MTQERVRSQREAREYQAFLERKVAIARASMRAGNGRSNEMVEAEFAARCDEALSGNTPHQGS